MVFKYSPVFASLLAIIFAATLLSGDGAVRAQNNKFSPATIAFVDRQRVIAESDAGKSVQAQLNAKRESLNAEMSTKQEKLRSTQSELQRIQESQLLAEDAFRQRVQDFEQEASKTQREVQLRARALEQGLQQALSNIFAEALKIAAEIAEDEGIEVVLDARQVLFADQSLNLTERVLTQLNQRLPTMELTVPEVPEEALQGNVGQQGQ
mgnify:CR=1 FL=1